jgi:N-methylhydantoinase A/acetophenone carboxylase
MEIAIHADTGAAFTHAVATGTNGITWSRVETDQGNPKRSFISCLNDLARKLGLSPIEMLGQTSSITWSTSIAGELLLQGGRGKLGLIISRSVENDLRSALEGEPGAVHYGRGLVRSDMIAGIKGRVDKAGGIIEDVDEEEIGRVIESLVDAGATGIVVSLSGAFANAVQEKKVREIMARKYPAHYLGSADLFLGSEVAAASDDRSRTHTAVVNAYLHRDINHHAGGAEDAVHDAGFRPPLLIAHGTGAAATQVHTKALDVYASSTARAGLGCAVAAKELYGVSDFIYMDAGAGASVRVGAVVGGKASIIGEIVINGAPANISAVDLRSAGGGGGAIARVGPADGRVAAGPKTAALTGGAAAFGLRNGDPTVTDADLALGYLDPDSFEGEGRKPDRDKALGAIREKIASITGQSVEKAAYAIIEAAETNIAEAIKQEIDARELRASDLTLIAFGGAGGSRCCGSARRSGIERIIVFPFNAVAPGYFSSTVDGARGYKPFPVHRDQGADPAKAFKGARKAYWDGAFAATPVYRQDLLAPAGVISGPAIIEAPGTTFLVAQGWTYTTDEYLNGRLEVRK